MKLAVWPKWKGRETDKNTQTSSVTSEILDSPLDKKKVTEFANVKIFVLFCFVSLGDVFLDVKLFLI